MPAFDTVKAGDVLYDVHRRRMGNTTTRQLCWWRVRVVSIDHAKGEAMCSWNGNIARPYYRGDIGRLRRSIPKKLAESQGLKTVTP